MVEALRHRGPDGEALRRIGPVALAHTRLAIIDVAGGDQPLVSEDGQVTAIVNGEIYNHRALRAELEQRGHRFATGSDSEVVLHAYEEHGLDCVRSLNGIFAFVLWDARSSGSSPPATSSASSRSTGGATAAASRSPPRSAR